jgi:hypothetical protein
MSYSGTLLTSSNAVNWTTRNTGTSNFLSSVAYGNGVFVVVGQGGTILSSPDGVTWIPRTSNTLNDLEAVTYANQVFVAVGYQGTILFARDGVTWQRARVFTGRWLMGVTYGNGMFLAVGEGGTALLSPDGQFWYETNTGSTNTFFGVTFGDYGGSRNRFFAFGERGTLLSSSDGFNWVYHEDSRTSNYLFSASSGNGAVVVVGDAGVVVSSTPGTGPGGPLAMRDPRRLPDGSFQITLVGAALGQRVTIESSDTLLTWQSAGSVDGTGAPVQFVDPGAANSPRRAYRAWVP